MAMWKYFFDNDWMQRHDIEENRRRAQQRVRSLARKSAAHGAKVKDLQTRVEEIEEEVGMLALHLKAAIAMLDRMGGWDPKEFAKVVAEIDAADGEPDGKSSFRPDAP